MANIQCNFTIVRRKYRWSGPNGCMAALSLKLVSYLLEFKEKKKKTIRDIINKFSRNKHKVEIVDENVDEIIDIFDEGYPYDEEDPQSIFLHSLKLRLHVHISRKRKSILKIDLVSTNALMVNFSFLGDEFDAPESDQHKEELIGFISLLKELYTIYEFKIGGIAIEGVVLDFYGFNEMYPNEYYRYENMSPDSFLKAPSPFVYIIWNEKYKKLSDIPYNYKRLSQDGILIETGSFNS